MSELELLAGERQPGESDNALIACNDWLRLGPGRSLPKLLARYAKTDQDLPPTDSLPTLKDWSAKYDWRARATAYDTEMERLKTITRQIEFGRGMALDYARVRELKRLARVLKQQVYARDEAGKLFNIWLHDVKWIGSGESGERVDIERFNAPLVDQYRGTLDDLARETGGRKGTTDVNLLVDKPVPITIIEAVPPEPEQQDESE